MALLLLSEVNQNIRQYLPQIQCLEQQDFFGQIFLRLTSTLCDENLVFTPPVEILVTHKNNEELNMALVSYKREVLEETAFRYCDQDSDTGQHTYLLYVQNMLCHTQLVLCQGTSQQNILTQFGKIRKSDLIMCLVEKSLSNKEEVVFRARQCRAVYTIGEMDKDTALCKECTDFFSLFLSNENVGTELDPSEDDDVKICPFNNCGKSFRRKKPWENHLKLHSNNKPKVSRKNNLKKDKRKKYDSKPKTCDIDSEVKCEPDIYSEMEVNSPMKTNTKTKKFQCNICSNSYLYKKAFENHMRSHETILQINTDLQCEICGSAFENDLDFETHMNKEHFNHFRCKVCPMEFTFRKAYNEHQSQIHSDIICVLCDMAFESSECLNSHNLENHDASSGDPCHICGKHVKRSSMANHIRMIHHSDEMRKHLCNICGNAYKTKTDLDRHYTKHTGSYKFIFTLDFIT